MDDQIADIRAFNRFYTGQIGLLEEHFNDSPLSLPEARVLYEIDARGHTTAGDLARALRMDRGYLSRILRKFADSGLTAMTPHLTDRRSSNLALTSDGDIIVERLNDKSNEAVVNLIRPLTVPQRQDLVAAMRTIRTLLGDELPSPPVALRPPRIGDIGWLVHRQGVLYHQQYGWNGEFEALIARIYADYHAAPETPPKQLWIAERGGIIAGSIFTMPSEGIAGSAQLRMLYVEPAARGLGIGRLLVDQCVAFAREAGYERMRLWTHTIQQSARKLYGAAGFTVVESKPHHAFGKDLISEIWEKRF
jgi:DNA-binding MarR family transcriptional regulator/N-acetylglutamate synthase-like GNAT family acetyltransferase